MWTLKSHDRLALSLVFILLGTARGKGMNVTWLGPSLSDVFSPGDTIIGQWKTSKAIVSPSFKLCMSSGDLQLDSRATEDESNSGCGSTVWPEVEQSAGSFVVSLVVPNMTSAGNYHLEMEDDFGSMVQSPAFSISLRSAATTKAKGHLSAEPTSLATSSATSPTIDSVTPPPSSPVPNILSTRSPPPTAALAVPLSLVGAILLVAGALCLYHRRKLIAERAREADQLALSRQSSLSSFKTSSTRTSDVEHALKVLSRNNPAYGAATPIPLFMPVDVNREPRQPTRRQAYPLYDTSSIHYTDRVNSIYSTRTPRSPYEYLPPIKTSSGGFFDENDDANATVTHSVIDSYLKPSPVLPPCLLSAPQRLHVRSEAAGASLPVPIAFQPHYVDKPLPRSPQP